MITAIVWLVAFALPIEDEWINRVLYLVAAILATIVVNR